MLRANQAVRLGLRAASRNPELSFGKALVDQGGSLLALLPAASAALLVVGVTRRGNLLSGLRGLRGAGWLALGGVGAALAILFMLAMLFWAGALPLLAADAELGRRPPPGNFTVLVSRGAGRVLAAGALAWALLLSFNLACAAALVLAVPLCVLQPSAAIFAWTALIGAGAVTGSVLVDLLARLTLVRAAAFGDGVSAAFGKASSLFTSRLGACLVVTVAFLFLEMIAATVAAMLTGLLPGAVPPDLRAELLALAPRLAIGLAAAAVFAWLEVARMAALAALSADAEGLIDTALVEPPPVAELVVEALPAPESPDGLERAPRVLDGVEEVRHLLAQRDAGAPGAAPGKRHPSAWRKRSHLKKRRTLIFFSRPATSVQVTAAPKSIAERASPTSAGTGQTVLPAPPVARPTKENAPTIRLAAIMPAKSRMPSAFTLVLSRDSSSLRTVTLNLPPSRSMRICESCCGVSWRNPCSCRRIRSAPPLMLPGV
jgi:hypothetical protein